MSQEYDIKLTRAIRNLKADTEFSWGGESPDNAEDFKKIKWITYENGEAVINTINPHSELTWTKVKAEMDRSDAEYDANEYARNRKAEYPIIADQLDDIYHNGIDGWKATIKITKDKYPKG